MRKYVLLISFIIISGLSSYGQKGRVSLDSLDIQPFDSFIQDYRFESHTQFLCFPIDNWYYNDEDRLLEQIIISSYNTGRFNVYLSDYLPASFTLLDIDDYRSLFIGLNSFKDHQSGSREEAFVQSFNKTARNYSVGEPESIQQEFRYLRNYFRRLEYQDPAKYKSMVYLIRHLAENSFRSACKKVENLNLFLEQNKSRLINDDIQVYYVLQSISNAYEVFGRNRINRGKDYHNRYTESTFYDDRNKLVSMNIRTITSLYDTCHGIALLAGNGKEISPRFEQHAVFKNNYVSDLMSGDSTAVYHFARFHYVYQESRNCLGCLSFADIKYFLFNCLVMYPIPPEANQIIGIHVIQFDYDCLDYMIISNLQE